MEDLQKFYNTEILEMPSNIASLLWRMDVNTGQRTNTKHNIMWLKTELFDHYNKAIKNMIVVAFCYFFPFQILDANTIFINKKIQTEACKNRWILIFTEAVNAMVKPVSTLYDCPFNNTCSFSWETSRLIGAFGQAIVEYSFIHLKQCLFEIK